MSPAHERPLRQGKGPALLTGLGAVLALLLALGLYAARSLSEVSRAGTLTARQYFQQSELLDRAHRLLSSSTGAVRDYLLDSDTSALAHHREDARRFWTQALSAIRDYQRIAPSGLHPLTRQLDSQVAGYWAVANPSLDLTGDRRRAEGDRLLLTQLVPLREKFLATINEIAAHDRADLRSSAAATAQFASATEQRLWAAIGLTVILSLLVAAGTVRYLMRLENTALAEYHASVKAGIELESLSRRLMTLQEDERRRIARELHDDYGQRMASLLFELSALADRAGGTPETKAAIEGATQHLSDIARDLQQLSRSLHSAVLDKIGLEAAIRSDANALRQRTGWQIEFHSANVPKRLPEPVSLAAYRVFQEALQNALKHSGTDRLAISLVVEGSELILRIQDFGRGFAPEFATKAGSLGLLSMRERLRMVGGTFAIHSQLGQGTTVEARLPLNL